MKTAKNRMTRQRRLIYEELKKSSAHPTADELFQIVRTHLPRISMGTVYRNLDFLIRAGLARKLENGGRQSRFDANISPHYHIRCRICNRVDDIRQMTPFEFDISTFETNGYDIEGFQLELRGTCADCRKAKEQ
jgi:Fur family ferric uptake transcriptional regulator